MPHYDTLDQAGYEYIQYLPIAAGHLLREKVSGNLEVWFSCKNTANYAIRWKNTHLEFAHPYRPQEDR